MSEYLKQIEAVLKSDAPESIKIVAINNICLDYDANERTKRQNEANLLYDPTLLERTRLIIA
jgi:hypothetical protein